MPPAFMPSAPCPAVPASRPETSSSQHLQPPLQPSLQPLPQPQSPLAPPPIEMFDAGPQPHSHGLGPGFRGGIVSLRYELRTRHARQVYRRDFLHLSQLMIGLDRARNFRGIAPDVVDQAELAVSRRLHDTQALLVDLTRRTEALLAHDGMADIPIQYVDPAAVVAPIANPRARMYMDMLMAADVAFSALERAWLFGLVDTRARRAHEASLRKAVRAVGSTIRSEYTAMARRVRGEPVPDSASTQDAVLAASTALAAGRPDLHARAAMAPASQPAPRSTASQSDPWLHNEPCGDSPSPVSGHPGLRAVP